MNRSQVLKMRSMNFYLLITLWGLTLTVDSQVTARSLDLGPIFHGNGINHSGNSTGTVDIKVQPDLCYCGGIKWYEIVIFFALNYVAHAFSVPTIPGESIIRCSERAIFAICFPYMGIVFALMKLADVPLYKLPWSENPLKKARRGGALCKVVRDVNSENNTLTSYLRRKRNRRTVFGQLNELPKGYRFDTLRRKDKVKSKKPFPMDNGLLNQPHERTSIKLPLPQSSTFLKATVSFGQAVYAVFTLLRASASCGKLIKFGYVSPAFTTIPYATMSLVNTLTTLTTPNYPMQYLVSSEHLEEAIAAGWKFDRGAIVGHFVDRHKHSHSHSHSRKSRSCCRSILDLLMLFVVVLLAIVCVLGPYAVMRVLEGFSIGQSTLLQRGIILTWLISGQLWGIFSFVSLLKRHWWSWWAYYISRASNDRKPRSSTEDWLGYVIGFLMSLPPAVLGAWTFYLVEQMLEEMGQCIPLK